METQPDLDHRHRFPGAVISHCVGLYFRFCLSYRDVEAMMAERGVRVTYEAIREWCIKFGQTFANELRRPRPGDQWHLAEVRLKIKGEIQSLWRGVAPDGHGLDIWVQPRRNKRAAQRFFRKLLKGLGDVPRVIIPDKLRSYGAAKQAILSRGEHRQHKRLNHRAEHSHPPTRERERRRRRFQSAGHAHRVLSAYGRIASHFRPRRHRMKALEYRAEMKQRFQTGCEITGIPAAA